MSSLKLSADRIAKALSAAEDGIVDGAHHKSWVIDQMVRQLTGCPLVSKTAFDRHGKEYTYKTLGENDEYKDWVARLVKFGYDWDVGVPP